MMFKSSAYHIQLIVILLLLGNASTPYAQALAEAESVASYEMTVELDIESKRLQGETILEWKNTSEIPIDELYFHLYYNAFKNSESSFFKERGVPEFLTKGIDDSCGWGWSYISSFIDDRSNELMDSMQYVQTDDGKLSDQTVLKINLVDPVLPNELREFRFKWEAKIPKTMPRTGYNKEFYFLAQWFPKLGVLEKEGMRFAEETQWNCHQYHSLGEYYADFGDYSVKLIVPSDYMVAASGELMSKEKHKDKTLWHFQVSDVIDFTWTCSPHYQVQEQSYKDTKIKFYSYPYKAHLAERYFNTILYALEFMETHVGKYPYPTLSIVDPPVHGMFTGGMEYPTLVTSFSFCFFPKGIKTPETLVVHEFIHQYFMQMVANNESEEAWMDEGITSYYESRILDSYMGDNCSTIDYLGFKTGNKKFNRVEYFGMDHPGIASNAIKSYEYKHGGYGEIAYNKAALWLQTLEGLIGRRLMDRIMRSYFEDWKYKHPCRFDFISKFNEMVKEAMPEKYPDGMDWFFDQVLYGTGMCDYAVASISNELNVDERGVFEDLDTCEIVSRSKLKYNSNVILYRLDELYFPVEIELELENGEHLSFEWDGRSRAHTIEIDTDHRIIAAHLDPDQKIYIDKNFVNNSYRIQSDRSNVRKLGSRIFVRLQAFFEIVAALI